MNKQMPKEWSTIDNSSQLLHYYSCLQSVRKLRLFAVHCCRPLKPLVNDSQAWNALQTATDFADGKASPQQLRDAWLAVRQALGRVPLNSQWEHALNALLHASSPKLTHYDVQIAASEAVRAIRLSPDFDPSSSMPILLTDNFSVPQFPIRYIEHRPIIRDLFPLSPVRIDPAWFAWEQGQLSRLALAIYEEEQFQDLPILADALEEAGCNDPLLLGHARSPGPHYRGCWLLDALMQRR